VSSGTLKSEEYRETKRELGGWPINITSYRIGPKWYCIIDNVSPGARFARAEGATREEAEGTALEKAARYLKQTRKFPTGVAEKQ
jgi:hypothetical protein